MEETLIKKIQPHSTEAEQSVIGSMIMDRDAIIVAAELLHSEDFYERQYSVLFEAMMELFNESKPVDLITLQEKLKEKDIPPEFSSLEFIGGLIRAVPTSANIRYYAGIVNEKALLRRLIKVTEGIATACYLDKEKADTILEQTEKEVFHLIQSQGSTEVIIEAASKNRGSVTGIATGFFDLDYKTAGLQPSDLILIAARPSMGKTAFVLNIAEYVAVKNHITTAIFSLEMSKLQLVN